MQGPLRINPKNYRQCFIPFTNNYIDVYVPWRNRAFNGDIVAVHLLEKRLSRVIVEDVECYLRLNLNIEFQLNNDSTASSPGECYTLIRVETAIILLLQAEI